jgi:hypothetical protein
MSDKTNQPTHFEPEKPLAWRCAFPPCDYVRFYEGGQRQALTYRKHCYRCEALILLGPDQSRLNADLL